MPSLNRELLFDISRKLVEDDEQDAVYRYGLSGKETFDILRNVFASVKVLQLFNDHYAIGWDNRKLCRFDFNGDKLHLKLLLNCVGESVKALHLGCQNMPMYLSIILNVIAAKNISSFTVDVKSDYIFASVLFASISKTLKELPLTFDTVTILDNQMADGMVFNFKKVSLTISSGPLLKCYHKTFTFDKSHDTVFEIRIDQRR